MPESSRVSPSDEGPEAARTVLDHFGAVAVGEGSDSREVGTEAELVDRHDRFDGLLPVVSEFFQFRGIYTEGAEINVTKTGVAPTASTAFAVAT